jgi:uncharacterized protein
MDITPLVPEGRQIVQSYGAGRFKISGIAYQGSVIVFPERTFSWPIAQVDDIDLGSLAPVLEAEPPVDILLVGCGAMMKLLPNDLRQSCRSRGIGVDVMDTGAACRTYNVLLAEARRVAAALVALDP